MKAEREHFEKQLGETSHGVDSVNDQLAEKRRRLLLETAVLDKDDSDEDSDEDSDDRYL